MPRHWGRTWGLHGIINFQLMVSRRTILSVVAREMQSKCEQPMPDGCGDHCSCRLRRSARVTRHSVITNVPPMAGTRVGHWCLSDGGSAAELILLCTRPLRSLVMTVFISCEDCSLTAIRPSFSQAAWISSTHQGSKESEARFPLDLPEGLLG